MYRRWTGVVNAALVMLHEKHFGWRDEIRYELRPEQYKALWSAMTEAEHRRVDQILPLSGEPRVVAGFQLALDLFVDLCRRRTASTGEEADFAFANHVGQFLRGEVSRYENAT